MSPSISQLAPHEFPSLLKEIPDPPKKLYYRGTPPHDNTIHLCVVGSRHFTAYGKEVCEKLIGALSGYPLTIVSGLAIGLDGIAHRAALKAGLATLAVPGSGLDDSVLYPRSHLSLAHEILKHDGTLLSEFEPKERATVYSFPQRNRIMAGLSHATLIIEAAEKSGTLITARLATDYNRDVLAVPGPIQSKASAGSHQLLRLGATLIRNHADILEALGLEEQEKVSDNQTLSKQEQLVLALLQNPLPRDALTQQLKLPIPETNILLSEMELKGLITERLGYIHDASTLR